MTHHAAKTAFAALVAGGLLAGCATSVDMGGPLLHYRYNYDSRPVVSESTTPDRAVIYREPEVRYMTPSVTYRTPAVTYEAPATVTYTAPATTYRAPVTTSAPVTTYHAPPATTTWHESRVIYRDPVVTYYEPRVVLEMHPSPSLAYKDHGQ